MKYYRLAKTPKCQEEFDTVTGIVGQLTHAWCEKVIAIADKDEFKTATEMFGFHTLVKVKGDEEVVARLDGKALYDWRKEHMEP